MEDLLPGSGAAGMGLWSMPLLSVVDPLCAPSSRICGCQPRKHAMVSLSLRMLTDRILVEFLRKTQFWSGCACL